MNLQERDLLNQFLGQLAAAPSTARDPEADALINQAVSIRPDSAYLLVQRSLLLEQALKGAQEKIAQLETQARQPAPAGGFLQGASAWGNSAAAAPVAGAIPGTAGPRQSVATAPMSAPSPMSIPAQASAGPSFLGTMAAGAAGAIGGALLLQGIEGMWHHNPAAGLAGSNGLGLSSPGQPPAGETVINNYYGGTDASDDDAADDMLAQDDRADSSDGDSDWA